MTQNGPKMMVNRKFLENGSNDFPDFWPEVGGQYLKKVTLPDFSQKNGSPGFEPNGPKTAPKSMKTGFSGKIRRGQLSLNIVPQLQAKNQENR